MCVCVCVCVCAVFSSRDSDDLHYRPVSPHVQHGEKENADAGLRLSRRLPAGHPDGGRGKTHVSTVNVRFINAKDVIIRFKFFIHQV